ncbi:Tyrosine-protein kinase receptor UFO [Dissostichus eleginoides]|uniref:Tyrosine-protein kinase receptor UFO n=1 Tax=Dissostichus eleginoides TaxID=100907 RepID=A0AAD9CD72_DISEL|nr:Tyrosine-protein kinase receptor UFO [Dissostichus eleginoides]
MNPKNGMKRRRNEEKGKRRGDLEFERSPNTVISSLGKPVTMQCTLKGTGGEEEDPPDVLWLRDGALLPYADTNQIQVHTGSNSWTIMSTLR